MPAIDLTPVGALFDVERARLLAEQFDGVRFTIKLYPRLIVYAPSAGIPLLPGETFEDLLALEAEQSETAGEE